MQDKYAGDIGDFGKFVFLRRLMELSGGMRLGINWYRTTRPELSSSDGRHVSYLDRSRPKAALFEACAPDIYRRLGDVVGSERAVARLERSRLLPDGTRYYSAPVPYESAGTAGRLLEREEWFYASFSALTGSDILFLDPDNGIQPDTATKSQSRAIKYAFLDEMREYFRQSEILVVYHHRDRLPTPVYAAKFSRAAKHVGAVMRVLRFKRASVRDYVFLYKPGVAPLVERLFSMMGERPYNHLFSEFTPVSNHVYKVL